MTDKYNIENEIGGNQGQGSKGQQEGGKNPATQQEDKRKSNQGNQGGNMPRDNR